MSTDPDPSALDPSALAAASLAAAALLEEVVADRGLLTRLPPDLAQRLLIAAGRASRPTKTELKPLRRARERERHEARRDADEALLARTGIRVARAAPIFATPSAAAPRELAEPEDGRGPDDGRRSADRDGPDPDHAPSRLDAPPKTLDAPRSCYVCKAKFTTLHPFYDAMCGPCGDFNLKKRDQTADLRGRTVLLTGGRVKIGYHAGIKLLRAGARLLVLTRFPVDAARRYASEPDAPAWLDRLRIFGLDLRNSPAVEALCQTLLATEPRLDHLVNNACQTVRRPPGFYRHLMDGERRPDLLPPEAQGLLAALASAPAAPPATQSLPESSASSGLPTSSSAELSQIPLLPGDADHALHLFPAGRLDADLQQVDRRDVNSWRLLAHEVPTIELLEVHLVNAVAPFVLNARLKELMLRTPERDKHIVNVSAMEGQFYRTFKTARHPHTNMAKASLNMLTRTSAPDYVRDGIHMNSVDTGWITDEDPEELAARKVVEQRFHPPLDVVDGAARILDPIFAGANSGEHVWGRFLKDYTTTDW